MGFNRGAYSLASNRSHLHLALFDDDIELFVNLRSCIQLRIVRWVMKVEDTFTHVSNFGDHSFDSQSKLLVLDVSRAIPRSHIRITRAGHFEPFPKLDYLSLRICDHL